MTTAGAGASTTDPGTPMPTDTRTLASARNGSAQVARPTKVMTPSFRRSVLPRFTVVFSLFPGRASLLSACTKDNYTDMPCLPPLPPAEASMLYSRIHFMPIGQPSCVINLTCCPWSCHQCVMHGPLSCIISSGWRRRLLLLRRRHRYQ
jgi:hypothetical protein